MLRPLKLLLYALFLMIGSSFGVFPRSAQADLFRKGPQFLVNSTISGYQHAARVTPQVDGGFLVAWDTDTTVEVRHFDSNSQPEGPQFTVYTQPTESSDLSRQPGSRASLLSTVLIRPAISASGDGSYIVSFVTGQNVASQLYDSKDAPLGDTAILTVPNMRGTRPSAAAVAPGSFIVAWWDPDNYQINVRQITTKSVTKPFSIAGDGEQYIGAVSSAGDGGSFQLSWYEDVGPSPLIQVELFQAGETQGVPLTVEQVVGQRTGTRGPQICTNSDNGEFAVTWETQDADASRVAKFRRFSPDGIPLSSPLLVTPDLSDTLQSFPDIACGGSGRLAITWADSTTFSDRGWLLDGSQKTNFNIGFSSVQDGEPMSPAILRDGDLVVVWHDCTPTQGCSIFGQRFTTQGQRPLTGDCDQNGNVTIDEVVRAVGIALSGDPASVKDCLAADPDLDYRISINELIESVLTVIEGTRT